ncbi:MAG: hypothetical protein VKM17_00960 [Cyanobacteriota bacterium]|nr:hypothetical protein [Cyanobacteriota bacterium]
MASSPRHCLRHGRLLGRGEAERRGLRRARPYISSSPLPPPASMLARFRPMPPAPPLRLPRLPAPSLVLAAAFGSLVVAALPPRLAAAPAEASGSSSPSIGEALQPSTAEQMAVANWLRQRGVIFYGAWWCPACFQQKNLFGKEAGNRLPYVECDKEDVGRRRCVAEEVRVFPTWVRGTERREGVQTLEELKLWSGYKAPIPAAP